MEDLLTFESSLDALTIGKVDKVFAIIDSGDDDSQHVLDVFATNSFSGRRARFEIENNQDTTEIDINFNQCTVNIGDTNPSKSDTASLIFRAPTGNTQQALQVKARGSATDECFSISYLGLVQIKCGGISTNAFAIKAFSDTQARYLLTEFGVTSWGPGGATAPDVQISRTAANELSLAAGDSFRLGDGAFLHWGHANNVQTTVGAAGGASALPATPLKYLKIKDQSGTTLVVPAYNA